MVVVVAPRWGETPRWELGGAGWERQWRVVGEQWEEKQQGVQGEGTRQGEEERCFAATCGRFRGGGEGHSVGEAVGEIGHG